MYFEIRAFNIFSDVSTVLFLDESNITVYSIQPI